LEKDFPTDILCQALTVSRAGYYRFRSGVTFLEDEIQAEMVEKIFFEHKGRYGSRRILAELKAQGMQIGRLGVRKSMQKKALKAIQPRSFVPKTTDSTHRKGNSPNLVLNQCQERCLQTDAPNQVCYSDITYLPMQDASFTYLCIGADLFSRRIVGWQIEKNLEEMLVITALKKALQSRNPAPGLIVHSDRGGQYVSNALRKVIKKWHCRQSMSRADNCYDNAVAESLFSRFKAELLQTGTFLSIEDARTEIFEYIEIYYNHIRRHSALGYQSPNQLEEKYYQYPVSPPSYVSH
jgi:putative transposase